MILTPQPPSNLRQEVGKTVGNVHSIETFGSVDGPGIRYVIFLSGCPLRCRFCHNPDTWYRRGQDETASEVFFEAMRYKSYWKEEGGITVSGGEPLSQLDFLIDLFKLAKMEGVNTCIDTSGAPFTRDEKWFNRFNELMQYTDLLLLDIKHINEEEHIKLTGKSGKNIIDMANYLSQIKKPIWIRHVLIPQITDVDHYLLQTRDFLRTLNNIKRVDILPYHSLGVHKWEELGIPYTLNEVLPPTLQRIENAKELLEVERYDSWKR